MFKILNKETNPTIILFSLSPTKKYQVKTSKHIILKRQILVVHHLIL